MSDALKNLTVLKIGGSLLDEKTFPQLVKALAAYIRRNPTIIVHGGGKEISALSEKLGIATRFVNGRRYTDPATMTVVEMVLSGKVNPYLTGHLNRLGIRALGLSGRSAGVVRAKKAASLGLVGLPDRVDAARILSWVRQGYAPVFASIADHKGGALNVNADEMASAIAAAVKARKLILFTDVPGILDAGKRTIPGITPAQGKELIRQAVITGGMIPKVNSAFAALGRGVREIWVLQGRLPLKKAEGTLLSRSETRSRHPFA